MAKKIAVEAVEPVKGSSYPAPFHEPCRERLRRRLGDVAGLSQFGVNVTRLPPGCWSSQRHWHTHEDEFVFVVEGELVLVTDAGEEILRAGDCAGFKAGVPDGHHLQNRSNRDAVVLEIGARRPEENGVSFPDIDMEGPCQIDGFVHRDGTPYPEE